MTEASRLPEGSGPEQARLRPALRDLTENFSPAYFGMVMATGIVSLSAHLLGMRRLAGALFGLNLAAYLLIWLLNVLRICWFRSLVFRDMIDHQRGPGYFTVVAGSCILGCQFVLIAANYRAALALWILGIVLWLGLTYAILTAFTIKESKPSLDEGITGAWLLAVVATQAPRLYENTKAASCMAAAVKKARRAQPLRVRAKVRVRGRRAAR